MKASFQHSLPFANVHLLKVTRKFLVSMRTGETPVPIPNTTVKTCAADGTMLETAWESRWVPDYFGDIAQLGEHLPCKQGVRGSNPLISTVPHVALRKLRFLSRVQARYKIKYTKPLRKASFPHGFGIRFCNVP